MDCFKYEMHSRLMLGMHWKRMSPEMQYYWLHKVKEHEICGKPWKT